MTRLSDLLRSAADRAPVGDASVSVSRAARRVRTQRGIRGVGNGVAGLGAFALVVFGVVQPGLATNSAAMDMTAPAAAPEAAGAAAEDSFIKSDGRSMAWGTCGSFPLQEYGYGGSDVLAIAADFDGGSTLEGGATLEVPVTVMASRDLTLTSTGPEAVVLWEGMVVATLEADQTEQALTLASGDVVDATASLDLVDCFAGDPLPAGKYELVVSQAFLDATPEPTPEPSSTPEPTVVPETEPAPPVVPETEPVPPDSTGGDTADSSESTAREGSAGVEASDVAILPVEPQGWDYRVTTEPIGFAIAGEPVDSPFADYYPQPWTPPVQPDDMLTPALARELFDAAATSAPWDMAKGTSRWTLPNGYGQGETLVAVEQGYFGCSWDGVSGLTFPSRSAELDLLTVSAEAPSRISVSYGWIVDDNPEFTLSVTNTSPYSIPGFYGEPNRALYLVKDGRVVAEAYPTNIDPNSPMLLEKAARVDDLAAEDPDNYWGLLAPGESVSGAYLWRDVNRCWRDDGTSATISAGTYTLLTVQSVSLQQYGTVASGGSIGIPEPAPLDDNVLVDPAVATEISIARAQDDWLELQMWTSLGTVTITTH